MSIGVHEEVVLCYGQSRDY